MNDVCLQRLNGEEGGKKKRCLQEACRKTVNRRVDRLVWLGRGRRRRKKGNGERG
jgi:hypothetical protein